jgi:hypothetical protein
MRFQERAVQEGVHSMLQALELNLVAARQPRQRAVLMVQKFLNYPDVKKAMSLITEQKFNWGVKQQLIMANTLANAQELVQEHKLKRNNVSRVAMQVNLELFDNTHQPFRQFLALSCVATCSLLFQQTTPGSTLIICLACFRLPPL